MKILSLFDGISCGRVALERAEIPVEVYYASEIDKYAIQVTMKNYPDTIQLGDVAKTDSKIQKVNTIINLELDKKIKELQTRSNNNANNI